MKRPLSVPPNTSSDILRATASLCLWYERTGCTRMGRRRWKIKARGRILKQTLSDVSSWTRFDCENLRGKSEQFFFFFSFLNTRFSSQGKKPQQLNPFCGQLSCSQNWPHKIISLGCYNGSSASDMYSTGPGLGCEEDKFCLANCEYFTVNRRKKSKPVFSGWKHGRRGSSSQNIHIENLLQWKKKKKVFFFFSVDSNWQSDWLWFWHKVFFFFIIIINVFFFKPCGWDCWVPSSPCFFLQKLHRKLSVSTYCPLKTKTIFTPWGRPPQLFLLLLFFFIYIFLPF